MNGNQFQVASFFDVFTELSLDGGNTWTPSLGPTQLVYKNAPTFQSTLADISNSLQLGLIDSLGIARSLSEKIHAAQNVTNPARDNILNAFENEVNAQAGKHIVGGAPFVLRVDADSLRNQTP